MNVFGAQGVYPTTRGQPSQAFTLQPGATRLIPAGTWNIDLGLYSCIQEFDSVQDTWVNMGGSDTNYRYVSSDGVNYRLANLQGCIVGGVVTTAGSAYLPSAPPTVVPTAGGAVLYAMVGGAVSTSVTVTNGGTNYLYPPMVYLDPPPATGNPGLQATGYATLSGTTVSTITIDNQGAGYSNVPVIYIIADPRDTTGSGASAVATLTGSGTITGIGVLNMGTPLTTMPTLTFGSGSAAATPIMVRSIGTYTVTTAGSGYSGAVEISALTSGLTAVSVTTNPKWTTNLVRTRKASIIAGITNSSITTSGQILLDGGIYAGSAPTAIIYGGFTGTSILNGAVAFTWVNQFDTVQVYPV